MPPSKCTPDYHVDYQLDTSKTYICLVCMNKRIKISVMTIDRDIL